MFSSLPPSTVSLYVHKPSWQDCSLQWCRWISHICSIKACPFVFVFRKSPSTPWSFRPPTWRGTPPTVCPTQPPLSSRSLMSMTTPPSSPQTQWVPAEEQLPLRQSKNVLQLCVDSQWVQVFCTMLTPNAPPRPHWLTLISSGCVHSHSCVQVWSPVHCSRREISVHAYLPFWLA